MDDILAKEIDHNNIRALDNLKYDYSAAPSDDEEDFEDVATQDTITSEMEVDLNNKDSVNIKSESKDEILDLGVDIIMPEASNSNINLPLSNISLKSKKDLRSKKEVEEEEREKMQ